MKRPNPGSLLFPERVGTEMGGVFSSGVAPHPGLGVGGDYPFDISRG